MYEEYKVYLILIVSFTNVLLSQVHFQLISILTLFGPGDLSPPHSVKKAQS